LNYKTRLRPVVIIGYNKVGIHLHRFIEKNDHLGIRSLGILDDIDALAELPKIGNIDDLEKIHKQTALLEAYIALPIYSSEQIKTLISVCERNGVRPNIIPNYLGVNHLTFKVNTIGDIPLLQIRYSPLDNYTNRFWKRVFDLSVAILLLVLATPILLLIALLVKIDSKGPVIYAPLRLGIDGKPFRVLKFRSMKTSQLDVETRSTVKDDPRITRLGKILRKYNLDELPQLLNVVRNEMSLVGPRPHRVHLNKVLQDRINSYMIRHIIKPGITGWAQVNGWRGPTDTLRQSKARTLHDLWYIENWTFGLDVYIMLLTVFNKKSTNAF
jgi:putative colanic acid biosynthesis UDP-glucose lipid carrier transferase